MIHSYIETARKLSMKRVFGTFVTLLITFTFLAPVQAATPEQVEAVVKTLKPYKKDYLARETTINFLDMDRALGLFSAEKAGVRVLAVHVNINDYDEKTKTYYSCYLNMVDSILDGIIDFVVMDCHTGTEDDVQMQKLDKDFTSTFFEAVGDPQGFYDRVIEKEALK